uniref:non-specific serine/threonine protein kinase n=1 Tax=Sphaerechinus granularis TaxID=39374 RepID=Q659I9_SPHGR|nr:Nek protein [Sphaerechinus granularis]
MEKYSYQKVLGMGNFGKAWLVRSRASRRPYVIKEINVVGMGEKERERAVNEVAILGRLRHVNIIRYREAFVAGGGGILSIVMEYGDGGDLAEKIEEAKSSGQSFNAPQILKWFVQLCLALYYIHSEKVLHRDLKPSNLFLTSKGIIKVGDFGIAKMLHNTMDHANTTIGTPYYLSPEICQRQPYNQKSDMWAAGCILYELVTLTRPFEGHELSTLIMRILRGLYTPIPKTYGTAIEELVAVLLSVSPGMRPSAHAILTSHNIRPFVKAFTDQRKLIPNSPSTSRSPETRGHTKSKKSEDRENLQEVSSNSPYAIPPRSQNASRRVRRFHQPDRFSDKAIVQNRQLKPMTDSPMVAGTSRASKKAAAAKPRIVHHYSASEPAHHVDLPVRPSQHRPARAMSQRKSARKTSALAVPRERSGRDGVSRYGADNRQIYSLYRKGEPSSTIQKAAPSQTNSHKKISDTTPSTISRKRRSCIPAIDALESPYPSEMPCGIPSKKRRQSLPERVKDSKFLSRLVSSESRTSKRLHSEMTGNDIKTEPGPHRENKKSCRVLLKTKTSRRQSEPPSTQLEVKSTQTPATREKHRASKTPRTIPTMKRSQRPRKGSSAPITCLFPKTPEGSLRPRTRIKHGTYTLNLPNASDERQAPSKCEQCECRIGRTSSGLNSDADIVPYHRVHTETEDKRNGDERESVIKSIPSDSSCSFGSPTSSSVGNFKRRNALRRRSRENVQKNQRCKSLRLKNDNKEIRLGAKPDVIPPNEDDVFLEPAEEQKVNSGRRLERTHTDDMVLKQDLEIAEFLHALMEKPGEMTSDLRGKFERLKMYLERRLGTERSSVAYNILSSTGVKQPHTARGSSIDGTTEDVVRLVSDVLGPGKMNYFPLLLQAVNLSNRCH